MGRIITAIVISFLCFINSTTAQNENLIVQGTSPNLYIVHKTTAKENYYSVGRNYNVAPKDIAAYNKLGFEKGLNLGQAIKIPLSKNNFVQSKGADSRSLIPVYHVVETKEGLYRISSNYNKVPLEQLKKWNNLSSDVVPNSTKLIVGYLKSDVQQMPETDVASAETKPSKSTQVVVNESAASKQTTAEVRNYTTTKPADDKTAPTTGKIQTEANVFPVSRSTINFNGGIFKRLYDEQQVSKSPITESGLSGVFKSTSGWKDGKYYCFNNNAPAGTILKITNNTNGKSVYAKVLDIIPDIAQNEGLVLHISNAAAEELGVITTRFDCSINYSK